MAGSFALIYDVARRWGFVDSPPVLALASLFFSVLSLWCAIANMIGLVRSRSPAPIAGVLFASVSLFLGPSSFRWRLVCIGLMLLDVGTWRLLLRALKLKLGR